VARVRVHVGNESGGLSEECVSADSGCFGRGDVDGLAGGFAAEWAEEKGVWVGGWRVVARTREVGGVNVEAFGDRLARRMSDWREECLPHQFTASSPDPKRGKARSELYIRDAALDRFET